MTPITHPSDFTLGATLHYLRTMRVKVFGRERGEDGRVEYYWVVDGEGKRFKAWPNQLTKINEQ